MNADWNARQVVATDNQTTLMKIANIITQRLELGELKAPYFHIKLISI
jgi:hypothetical protein